jgi:hypothetical protein
MELFFSPPTPAEAEALARAARYLSRAASETASRLLPADRAARGQIELLAALRDDLAESAALCRCLLDVFDEWPVESDRAR